MYLYWDGPASLFAEACIQRMRDLNPSWHVVLASGSTCEELCGRQAPGGLQKVSHAKRSDWFRLHALARTGGVYLDASCLCSSPLESWVDMHCRGLQAFLAPSRKKKIVATWALACPPKCRFVELWAEEFHRCIEMGLKQYRDTLPPYAFPGKGALKWNRLYFTPHHIALQIRAEHPEYEVVLYPSLDGGPLSFTSAQVERGLVGPIGSDDVAPFFKINSALRKKLDSSLSRPPPLPDGVARRP